MGKIIRFLREIHLFKTFWFNLHYFRLKIALRLPVFVYKGTSLKDCRGEIRIEIDGSIKTGMIKLGSPHVGFIDRVCDRTVWTQYGVLVIKGACEFGSGSKICIDKGGKLELGPHFMASGGSLIICNNEVSIGSECLLSWDVQIMDADFHKIMDDSIVLNNPRPIRIGDHVWIGSRCTILKGVHIANGCVIAAASVISRDLLTENTIYGGHGKDIKELRNGIRWED